MAEEKKFPEVVNVVELAPFDHRLPESPPDQIRSFRCGTFLGQAKRFKEVKHLEYSLLDESSYQYPNWKPGSTIRFEADPTRESKAWCICSHESPGQIMAPSWEELKLLWAKLTFWTALALEDDCPPNNMQAHLAYCSTNLARAIKGNWIAIIGGTANLAVSRLSPSPKTGQIAEIAAILMTAMATGIEEAIFSSLKTFGPNSYL